MGPLFSSSYQQNPLGTLFTLSEPQFPYPLQEVTWAARGTEYPVTRGYDDGHESNDTGKEAKAT